MGQIQNCPESPEVSVFLLAENRLLRDTLARLLRKRSEINVVGISRDTKAITNEIAESSCEVVLTDCFSTESHTSLLSELLNQNADVKILLFGMDEDSEIFLEAVQLGIQGVCPERCVRSGNYCGSAGCRPWRSLMSSATVLDLDSTCGQRIPIKTQKWRRFRNGQEQPHTPSTPVNASGRSGPHK